jgi:hypothetical protein
VHLYAVGVRQVPSNIQNESEWDALFAAEWRGLDALRIGSTGSDEAGRFTLDYDPESLPRSTDDGARPNIWLAVTGADLTSAHPCARVVHASCDIRVGAGPRESFLIHVDAWRLRRLGLLGGVPQVRRGKLSAETVLGAVDAVATAMPEPDLNGVRFSEHFNDRHAERAREMAASGIRPRKQSEFALPIGLGLTSVKNPRLSIRPDPQSGRLQVHSQTSKNGKPLVFKDIRRRALKSGAPAMRVEIDETSGAFELVLAPVPGDLKLDQKDPLALWVPEKPV